MRPMTNNAQLLMEKTMSGLWTRAVTITNNIANAETPNYKSQYVTFEDTLKSRLGGASRSARPGASIREALNSTSPVIQEAQESTRMDGNGVNVAEQNLELARTGIEYQYVMQAITANLATLRSAIRGQ